MFKNLNKIKNVHTELTDDHLKVKNLSHFEAYIIIDEVSSSEIVTSSIGEEGFKFNFLNESFLIITSDDFIFNTQNFGVIKVENLPEIVSLNAIYENVEQYIENPEPDNNIDNTVALYLFNKILLENAEFLNFDVDDLKEEVRSAALKTSAIDDLTIYD